MGKGSQLTQLKSALSNAGLSRKSQPGSAGQKRKRSAANSRDPAAEKQAKARKLDEISKRLNPFDIKVTNLKHDVGGRKVKGVVGHPSASKQQGLDKRRKLLLPELDRKNRSGGIVDRRFGESDSTLTPEERMLERFTKERQRGVKGVDFNLDDDNELTHYGQSLSAFDDFDGSGLALEDNIEEGFQFTAESADFDRQGGEENEERDPEEPPRKKSKAEVMSEVIAKSKEHKHLRQLAKEQDDKVRHEMDGDFNSVRDLLFGKKVDPSSSGSNAIPLGVRGATSDPETSAASTLPSLSSLGTATAMTGPSTAVDEDEYEYDQIVRQLAFDKRAKPTDRTKTEEEVALEEVQLLQRQEHARLRRMRGEPDSGSDDGNEGHGKAKRRKVADADDLEDDLDLDGDEDRGLGPGLEDALSAEESGAEDKSAQDSSDSEDVAGEYESEESDNEHEVLFASSKPNANRKASASAERKTGDELPFTFPCPANHEEFLGIIGDIDAHDIPTVISRIRTIYHPSLAEDNKTKLQTLCDVLIDHALFLASPPASCIGAASSMTTHIYALSKQYPVPSAQFFISKLILMQKNLLRGLQRGPNLPTSKTWPGSAELALLKLIGEVWSTSDLVHPVVGPAMLLIGQYLGTGRIRNLSDISSGLFLCSISLQYHRLSSKLVPEAVNFLYNALILLSPHSLDYRSLPGTFPILDFAEHDDLSIKIKETTSKKSPKPPRLSDLLNVNIDPVEIEQAKVDLLGMTLHLLRRYADLYKSMEGFVELFEPLLELAHLLDMSKLSQVIQKSQEDCVGTITKLVKFAKQARRPLTLQNHKPIPIASYAPKFDEGGGYAYRKRHDPDAERNAASKLRAEFKKEKKGALRELRRDNRFLAEEQSKRQREIDEGYSKRMARVHGEIQSERAEEKAMLKEKAKLKKRAGGK